MRKSKIIILSGLFICIMTLGCQETPKEGEPLAANDTAGSADLSDQQTGAIPRAAQGDSVWIFVNHIKADKREQFEKFVHEIFWDSAGKLSAAEQQLFRKTRVLHPIRPEQDGTYSYVFIMDPVIPGGNYDIEKLTKQIYGEEKAREYLKMFDETNTKEQTGYFLVQSRH
jgi:hypothetical protein